MWPFRKTMTVVQSGILKGMSDCHSHLLSGVDDGVQTLDESLEILATMERLGVRKVWLTPHVMEDIPNETTTLQGKFQELKRSYSGTLELVLAAEYMVDNLFEERLERMTCFLLKRGNVICWWRLLISVHQWDYCLFCNVSKRKAIIRCWRIRNGMNTCKERL